MKRLILWIVACGIVVLCSADLAEKAHRSAMNNDRPTMPVAWKAR